MSGRKNCPFCDEKKAVAVEHENCAGKNIKCKECKCRAKEMQAEIDGLRDDNIALMNKIVELQS